MNAFQFLSKCILLFIFEAICAESISISSPEVFAKTTFVNCDISPTYVQNVSCKLKPINWEHNVINIDVDLVQVVRNASVRLEAFKFTNQYRPFLINVTLNACKLFEKGRQRNGYFQAVLNIVAKYLNVRHSCPYSGHIYLHGAYVDYKHIPFYIPMGQYKLLISFLNGWPFDRIGEITYIFKVAERTGKKSRRGNEPVTQENA